MLFVTSRITNVTVVASPGERIRSLTSGVNVDPMPPASLVRVLQQIALGELRHLEEQISEFGTELVSVNVAVILELIRVTAVRYHVQHREEMCDSRRGWLRGSPPWRCSLHSERTLVRRSDFIERR